MGVAASGAPSYARFQGVCELAGRLGAHGANCALSRDRHAVAGAGPSSKILSSAPGPTKAPRVVSQSFPNAIPSPCRRTVKPAALSHALDRDAAAVAIDEAFRRAVSVALAVGPQRLTVAAPFELERETVDDMIRVLENGPALRVHAFDAHDEEHLRDRLPRMLRKVALVVEPTETCRPSRLGRQNLHHCRKPVAQRFGCAMLRRRFPRDRGRRKNALQMRPRAAGTGHRGRSIIVLVESRQSRK